MPPFSPHVDLSHRIRPIHKNFPDLINIDANILPLGDPVSTGPAVTADMIGSFLIVLYAVCDQLKIAHPAITPGTTFLADSDVARVNQVFAALGSSIVLTNAELNTSMLPTYTNVFGMIHAALAKKRSKTGLVLGILGGVAAAGVGGWLIGRHR